MTTSINATLVHFAIDDLIETNPTDQQLVEFYTQNHEVIDSDEEDEHFVWFLKQAEAAQDRLNKAAGEVAEDQISSAKSAQPEMSNTEWQAQNRRKLAYALGQNGHFEAESIVEKINEFGRDGKVAAQAMTALGGALKAGGARFAGEDWTKVGWALFHKILRPIAEGSSENQVMYFLGFLLRALSSLSADRLANDVLRGAEIALERAKPVSEWSRRHLEALDRLIADGELVPWDDASGKAEGFIIRLQEEVRAGIFRHKEANAKSAQDKRNRQEANQASRAMGCRGMRGSNEKSESRGKGKKSKRREGDPNRHGKK